MLLTSRKLCCFFVCFIKEKTDDVNKFTLITPYIESRVFTDENLFSALAEVSVALDEFIYNDVRKMNKQELESLISCVCPEMSCLMFSNLETIPQGFNYVTYIKSSINIEGEFKMKGLVRR